jgi:hypothetical protein
MLCPYCKTPNSAEAKECSECHEIFPWAADVAKLREELKEREVNRGRATFTLIDEAFGAATGGKPISVAAIKGFAFAWLFPRALIVVGSLLTGIVLGIQTFILFQQTRLLQDQTRAAQYAQTESLRARVLATERVLDSMRSMARYAAEARAAAGVVETFSTACGICSTTTFAKAMSPSSDNVAEPQDRMQRHFVLLDRFARRVALAAGGAEHVEATEVAQRVDDANKHCGFPLASARRFAAYYASIRSFWIPPTVAVNSPPEAAETPTRKNFDNFMDPSLDRDPSELGSHLPSKTSVDSFIKQSLLNMSVVAAELESAKGTCVMRLMVDRHALLELERSISPEAFNAQPK